MTAIEYLDQTLKSQCANVVGIGVGKWDDKSTWRIDVSGTASLAQQDAMKQLLVAFDKAQWESAQPIERTVEERLTALERAQGIR